MMFIRLKENTGSFLSKSQQTIFPSDLILNKLVPLNVSLFARWLLNDRDSLQNPTYFVMESSTRIHLIVRVDVNAKKTLKTCLTPTLYIINSKYII